VKRTTRPFYLICAIAVAGMVMTKGLPANDDSLALQRQINSCRTNGTVELQPRLYLLNSLRLKSNCTYAGVSGRTVIKLITPNQFIFDVSEQRNITIRNIQFDGSGIGGAIIARENGPASGIRIENCSFTGVSERAVFPANISIVSTWALIDSSIRNNTFEDVAAGIWLTTVQNVNIENNSFHRITQGDAVYIAPNPVPFPSGENLRISGNHGSEFARMAIEIFRPDPPNGSALEAPVIENNEFSDWTSASNGFGLSITHGDGAIIRNNVIRNTRPTQQYLGIEVIVRGALVEANRVEGGFAYGVAVQGTAAPKIISNTFDRAFESGIILACDEGRHRCASPGSIIEGNTITNARRSGIDLGNDWAGSQVERNTITRAGGAWPGDDKTAFCGIHTLKATAPGTIEDNTILQTAAMPPKGFAFCGFNITAPLSGAVIMNNTVRSDAVTPLGTGIVSAGSAASSWKIDNNNFVNLVREHS
jgi:parallel beta-helix repeat protein